MIPNRKVLNKSRSNLISQLNVNHFCQSERLLNCHQQVELTHYAFSLQAIVNDMSMRFSHRNTNVPYTALCGIMDAEYIALCEIKSAEYTASCGITDAEYAAPFGIIHSSAQ